MTAAIVALVAWGVGAFGAVYPWAYGPLLAGAAFVGVWGLIGRPARAPASPALWAALFAVGAAVALQLVPLPRSFLQSLSPETDRLLGQYSLSYAASSSPHPISIDPQLTTVGLVFIVCLSLFLAGVLRHLAQHGTEKLATAIVAVGLVVALVGIIQRASHVDGRVYGFWTPQFRGDIFGPFVNRDHFAGWMLMAIPVAIGSIGGRLAVGMRRVKPGLRSRLVWLSSREAGSLLLVAASATIMTLSLLLTLSRSAMIALAASLLLSVAFAAMMKGGMMRRALTIAGVTAIVWLAVSWAGFDQLAGQFSGAQTAAQYRIAIWRDAAHIWSLFPLTGTGFNTFGVATLFYQTVPIDRHFAQAHNDYLQIASEGGLLVGIPVLAAVLFFVKGVWQRLRESQDTDVEAWIRRGAILGIVAIGLQEAADFSLQMPGNALLFTVLCAVALHPAQPASCDSITASCHKVRYIAQLSSVSVRQHSQVSSQKHLGDLAQGNHQQAPVPVSQVRLARVGR